MKIRDGERLRFCTSSGETIADLTVVQVDGPHVVCVAELAKRSDLPEIALLHELVEASEGLAFGVIQAVEEALEARGVVLQDDAGAVTLRLGVEFSGLVMAQKDQFAFALQE